MNIRESFHKTMNADPATEACPVLEWASWWNKTIDEWENEGMPAGMSQAQLFAYFGLDRHIQLWLPTRRGDCPVKHDAPLVTDLQDYLSVKPYLLPDDAIEQMLPAIEEAARVQAEGKAVCWFTLEGFFWFPRTLFGIEPHMYSFYDEPDLYHRMCEDLLAWQIRQTEKLAAYLKADFMSFAEDMSYNHGPMISQALYETFLTPYYRQIIPVIQKSGTRVFADSDGDISKMLPWMIDAGIEGVLPLEHQAGVDIGALQAAHPAFLFLGGFDKMCLMKDKAAIDRELARILPMLRRGRYLPSVDHQTPPGVSLENYRYYVMRLRELSKQACKDVNP